MLCCVGSSRGAGSPSEVDVQGVVDQIGLQARRQGAATEHGPGRTRAQRELNRPSPPFRPHLVASAPTPPPPQLHPRREPHPPAGHEARPRTCSCACTSPKPVAVEAMVGRPLYLTRSGTSRSVACGRREQAQAWVEGAGTGGAKGRRGAGRGGEQGAAAAVEAPPLSPIQPAEASALAGAAAQPPRSHPPPAARAPPCSAAGAAARAGRRPCSSAPPAPTAPLHAVGGGGGRGGGTATATSFTPTPTHHPPTPTPLHPPPAPAAAPALGKRRISRMTRSKGKGASCSTRISATSPCLPCRARSAASS